MSSKLDLDFLYYFSAPTARVLEARINGLPEDTPPGQVYHWLYCDRQTGQLLKLDFRAMGSEDGRDFRHFAQGELHFDAKRAELSLQMEGGPLEVELAVESTDSVPAELVAQVQQFLQQLSEA